MNITIPSSITTIAGFHAFLQQALHLPPYYGKNLDALWDCLMERPAEARLHITWQDFEQSKLLLGDFAEKALALFREAAGKQPHITVEVHTTKQ